jgi:hypothetical protein
MASDIDPIRVTLTMSPSLNEKLEQLAIANCAAKAEILRKVIVLYEVAYHASLKDQRLGVIDNDNKGALKIVGL